LLDASSAGVIVDGSALDSSMTVLTIASDGNRVSGVNFENYTGTAILVSSGAKQNVIGGDRTQGAGPNGVGNAFRAPARAVVVSGTGTNGNVLLCNYFGLNPDGMGCGGRWNPDSPAIVRSCVLISDGAQSNRVGGTATGERNSFGQCGWPGALWVTGPGTDSNVVIGNNFGLDANGANLMLCGHGTPVPMQMPPSQIQIDYGASRNRIGGYTPAERNLIAGANNAGINFVDLAPSTTRSSATTSASTPAERSRCPTPTSISGLARGPSSRTT
jgi:hypothetical protein